MRFSLRQLEAFRLFSTTLSVTRTAQLTHVSQSAVSHALRELETELGLKLFFRIGNRLRLTAEGKAVLPAIERVFSQISRLESEVEEIRAVGAGHLSVATMPPVGTWLVNGAAARFLQTRPGLHFAIRNAAAPEVLDQVRNEAADIGFTITGGDELNVRLEPLLNSEIVCVVRPDHPLAAKDSITAADLVGERVIAPSAETAVGFALRAGLPDRYVRRTELLEINQSAVAVDLVARGLGVALVHPFGLLAGVEGVELRAFRPSIGLSVMMAFSRSRPPSRLLSSFVDDIRTVADEAVARSRNSALRMEVA